jgi:hypothetical protein
VRTVETCRRAGHIWQAAERRDSSLFCGCGTWRYVADDEDGYQIRYRFDPEAVAMELQFRELVKPLRGALLRPLPPDWEER